MRAMRSIWSVFGYGMPSSSFIRTVLNPTETTVQITILDESSRQAHTSNATFAIATQSGTEKPSE